MNSRRDCRHCSTRIAGLSKLPAGTVLVWDFRKLHRIDCPWLVAAQIRRSVREAELRQLGIYVKERGADA